MTASVASPLVRLAAGEPSAVRECVTAFGAMAWTLALRSSADETDAEEAVREIFDALWQEAGCFDPSWEDARTFVAALARRRLEARARRRGAPATHDQGWFNWRVLCAGRAVQDLEEAR